MKRAALILFSMFACGALGEDDPFVADGSDKVVVQEDDAFKVIADPAGKAYFPEGRASYYTKYLSAMKEPSVLSPQEKGVERVFRFTYLRSFHDPLVVRITETGDTVTARAVRLEMDQQYQPVKIVSDRTWKLDGEGRKAVKALPEQKGFWTPLNLVEEAIASSGLDGSKWVFEVHDKDGYRMIDVWTPEALVGMDKDVVDRVSGDLGKEPVTMRDFLIYKKTGEKLLEIGGILPEPDDRY
ncbi:hypothetical protein OKA05_03955 [Luteolibacter arcticus]|uniref:DUF4412 domain-containing protein n=1 Tax=Luteolibacter arcticus TaxID=1581411 RepID=A0ABT3GEI9_9BACT|nr:hypothetical protein [Luteolibacter arcticus]MCW1921693.1 hypothetical protein [Luteolibacter arcticus]